MPASRTERTFTLFDLAPLGETVPGLSVVLPAPLELHHGGRAAVPVDDAAVPGQGLGQPLGLALDAHLHGRRVHGLVRIVAVAGDGTTVDHLGRYNVDDGVVDFGHGVGGSVFLDTVRMSTVWGTGVTPRCARTRRGRGAGGRGVDGLGV